MSDSIKELANRFYNLPEPKENVNIHKGLFNFVKALEMIGMDESWKQSEMIKIFKDISEKVEEFGARLGGADERIKILRAIISDITAKMTASGVSLPEPTQKLVFLRMFNELRDELDTLPEPPAGTNRHILYKAIPFFVTGCGIHVSSGNWDNGTAQKAEEALAALTSKCDAQDEWINMLQDLHNLTQAILGA